MKISIVIVTYNSIKWIKNCLESILESSLTSEIIIIDNYSTDNTLDFLKENYLEKIRLIESNENIGFGRANNLGISLSLQLNSDFIFLLNQDTVIEKETIERLLEVSIKSPEFGIISPIHQDGRKDSLDMSFLYYITRHGKDFISDSILSKKLKDVYEVEMINAAAWFVPRKTFEIVGGFDPFFFMYGEDDNFCQRVLYHNLKIGITPRAMIKHYSDNNNSFMFTVGSDKYYEKFLNGIKVKYGNVNSDYYKKIDKLRLLFLKKAIFNLLKLDFINYQVYKNKYILIDKKSIVDSLLLNRKMGKKYLE